MSVIIIAANSFQKKIFFLFCKNKKLFGNQKKKKRNRCDYENIRRINKKQIHLFLNWECSLTSEK